MRLVVLTLSLGLFASAAPASPAASRGARAGSAATAAARRAAARPRSAIAPRWLDRVPLGRRGSVALFDADGTLWHGDAGRPFEHWLGEEGHLRNPAAPPPGSGGDTFERRARQMKGLTETALVRLSERFFDRHMAGRIYAPMLDLIDGLHDRGVDVFLVSASNPYLVTAGARHFGIPGERVIAMSVEVEDGLLTDRLIEPRAVGAGKAARVARALPGRPVLFAAGDSPSDAPMLALADTALVVNLGIGFQRGRGLAQNLDHMRAAARFRLQAVRHGWLRASLGEDDTIDRSASAGPSSRP